MGRLSQEEANKKYHLVEWSEVCRSKDLDEFGFDEPSPFLQIVVEN